LQSCSSVHHTVERIKIYTFLYENFFYCRVRFSLANLPKPHRAIVGEVTQLFLRKVLPANHQKDRRSNLGSIQTNNILAFPPFLPLERSSLQNIDRRSFLNQTFPCIYLLPPYLHCSSSTSITTRMNSEW
jgi:hypothetical protein